MRLQYRLTFLLSALFLCYATLASGASVSISSAGAGQFIVQGDSMNGVAGIDMTIAYDSSTLSSPTVTWGGLVSGALSIANTKTPGTIKIAIIRTEPFSGSGPVAAIQFAGTAASGITSFSARMIDAKGGSLQSEAGIMPGAVASGTAAGAGILTAAGIPFSQSEPPRSVVAAAAAPVPAVTAGLGSVAMPADVPSGSATPPDPKPAVKPAGHDEPVEAVVPRAIPPVAEKPAEQPEAGDVPPTQTVFESVLERFRGYQSESRPEAMTGFYAKPISLFIRQEPAIAVADGKASVRILMDLSAVKGTSANFALSGARLVSLRRGDAQDVWVLEALPQAGVTAAAVTVLTSSSTVVYPLTVVPPVAGTLLGQTGFAAFLKDKGAKTPLYDLNNDGRHDYLDDYIYTGHYLLRQAGAAPARK